MSDVSPIGADPSRREPLLYFSYGGNMDPRQIGARCRETPEPDAIARLADHALVFHGADERWEGGEETLARRPGSEVWGVVWRLSAAAFDRLDAWQGVKLDGTGACFHSPADVVTAEGAVHSILTYRKASLGEPRPPSAPHLAMIAAAARAQGLPAAYVEALAASESIEPSAPVPREARADRFLAAAAFGASCAC